MAQTTFSDILLGYVMQEIDDETWADELALSPARFFRAKSDSVLNGISRFNRPPEVQQWLAHVPPKYDDFTFDPVGVSANPFVIHTGKTGFEMCSVVVCEPGRNGVSQYSATSEYDATTGDVKVYWSIEGSQYVEIDFYSDGRFIFNLDEETKNILGLCIAYNWFNRFAANWLNMQPKIRDKSFDIASESAHMTSATARSKELRLTLDDRLLHYEQNLYYRQQIPNNQKLKAPTIADIIALCGIAFVGLTVYSVII